MSGWAHQRHDRRVVLAVDRDGDLRVIGPAVAVCHGVVEDVGGGLPGGEVFEGAVGVVGDVGAVVRDGPEGPGRVDRVHGQGVGAVGVGVVGEHVDPHGRAVLVCSGGV